jgi:hypothetical protein
LSAAFPKVVEILNLLHLTTPLLNCTADP